ncbi:facilitated trehalose transporter Tret1-like [Agrilus planipennis]|uniref:Facilitated trehalose transporter Tret1-like n=1 Tax=Agrilus planipennis TaxID=224129 RepID=A0A1W4XA91_AGRPL|nr:facilitated trehalose transporter Tret1-like [Agrilus planipennis]
MMISFKLTSQIKQYAAAACVGSVYTGMSYTWSSPVIPQLEHGDGPFTITTEEASWIGSIIAFGAGLLAVPSGYLADRFGRKRCTLILTLPIIIFIILVYVGNNVYYIYAGRIFSGFATGGLSAVAPVYLTEIAEVKVRAPLNSFFQALIYCGSFCNAVFGKYLDYKSFTLISNALGIILIFGFVFFPESPTFLMMKNDRTGAENALKFYRDDHTNIKVELDAISKELEMKAKVKVKFWSIWSSKVAKRSLLACLGIIFFQICTGIDVLLHYSVSIFEIAGSNMDPYTSSIVVASAQVLSTFLAVNIIEKFKRKTFIYISAAGTGIMMILLGMFFHLKGLGIDSAFLNFIPLLSTVLFFVFFFVGLGPLPWLVVGELLPVEIKGPASGLTILFGYLATFFFSKTFPLMIKMFEPQYTFYTYAISMVLCIIFTKFCIPETKGKTLQEIQEKLDSL